MAHQGKRMISEDLLAILESISKNGIAKITTSNIKTLSNEDIESLKCGDIVAKVTGDQKHAYIVSYKEDGQGICLTYIDATYVETISYDYTDGNWVYNSQDSTEIQPKLTAGDNIQINGNTISATDTTYTAGTNITIEDGVISASGGTVELYEHDIRIKGSASNHYCEVMFSIFNNSATPLTHSDIDTYIKSFIDPAYPLIIEGIYDNGSSNIAVAMYYENQGNTYKITWSTTTGNFNWISAYAFAAYIVYDNVKKII